ncbi:exocyst subunit exo70 family protein B1 [Wolffia australiana]
MAENDGIKRSIRALDRQISRLAASDRWIWASADDSMAFLDAVDSLLSLMAASFEEDKTLVDRAEELLQRAMLRLRDEFRALLDSHGGAAADPSFSGEDSGEEEEEIPTAPPVSDYNLVVDALPAGTIADLRDIARRMAVGGFQKELAQAYSLSRREFLEESLARLGHRRLTPAEVNSTPWPELEEEIYRWVVIARVAAKILFPSERRLCERVFAGLPAAAEVAMAELSRGPAMDLLAFADAVAVAGKAPEKLFRLLDLFAAVRDLLPDLEQSAAVIGFEATATRGRLAAAIRAVLALLENLTRRDPARAPLPGAGPHPITRYLLNYLHTACEYRRELEEVMAEEDGGGMDPEARSSSLAVRLAWTMDALQENLEAKAAAYEAPGQSFLFLANNGWYTIQKLRESEVRALLGEDWLRRQSLRVRQWRAGYVKASWGKAAEVLHGAGGGLRRFEDWFEERCREQRGWAAADGQLRMELRRAAAQAVVTAYRRFLDKAVPEELGKAAKFSPERVEACILELFQETPGGPR